MAERHSQIFENLYNLFHKPNESGIYELMEKTEIKDEKDLRFMFGWSRKEIRDEKYIKETLVEIKKMLELARENKLENSDEEVILDDGRETTIKSLWQKRQNLTRAKNNPDTSRYKFYPEYDKLVGDLEFFFGGNGALLANIKFVFDLDHKEKITRKTGAKLFPDGFWRNAYAFKHDLIKLLRKGKIEEGNIVLRYKKGAILQSCPADIKSYFKKWGDEDYLEEKDYKTEKLVEIKKMVELARENKLENSDEKVLLDDGRETTIKSLWQKRKNLTRAKNNPDTDGYKFDPDYDKLVGDLEFFFGGNGASLANIKFVFDLDHKEKIRETTGAKLFPNGFWRNAYPFKHNLIKLLRKGKIEEGNIVLRDKKGAILQSCPADIKSYFKKWGDEFWIK